MDRYYVIVLNGGSVREEFNLDTEDIAGNQTTFAESLFEKRKFALENGHIKEMFRPFESKVYIIENI